MSSNTGKIIDRYILPPATFIAMAISLYLIFLFAPTEKTMGNVQRIFYFHVPAAWIAGLAFAIVFIASMLFLIRKDLYWDRMAYASAETGIIFCTMVLITGPLWAKPAWGIYWTWDARLTSFLILWLIYVGYLMLREFSGNELKRASLSAVVGIIGFLNIPIVYFSITLWRTLHPQPVFGSGPKSGLDPDMRIAFFVSLFTFTLLYIMILRLRLSVASTEEEAAKIQKQIQALEH